MTFGFGLIGASNIAQAHMIAAIRSQPDCEVVSVYSSHPERGFEYAKTNQIPHSANTLEDLLSNPAVQAVYISTTNELHYEQTLAAAKAGKHILCEKPLAMTLDQARRMIKVCQQHNVVLATNHHLRNAASHRTMRRLISEGAIGQPIAARVFHAVYLPEHLQGWRLTNPNAGAGVVLDITVHDVDTLRFVLNAEPVEVTSLTQHFGMGSGVIEDGAMAIFRFDNGVIAQTHEGFTTKYASNGFEVHGTEGSLIAKRVMQQAPMGEVMLRNAEGEQFIPLQHENLYEVGMRRFMGAVNGKDTPAATGEDGFASLAAALACLDSANSRQTVAIPSFKSAAL
ncbi:MAG: Gfo/Idh/MocA family oxidoreductase [Thiofilum sp.]|uniref:Gfo/Idh/MocA family protein n=1 Tax=Thiofilum sp. TaxID=2212733 RepID=UPI0025CBE145|nr:Gfo/Idh/MocA family oxidoreductase [Thiofilum sp.]MBK8454393.1 Gfo/Idh/MocA family oxidoreductase [Thiofilum sp.]